MRLRFPLALFAAVSVVAPSFALELRLPVDCEVGKTCFVQSYVDRDASQSARDYTCGTQTYDGHNGTDFRVPDAQRVRKGVDVLAAADGLVTGARDGMADLSIRAPGAVSVTGRECGNGVAVRHDDGFETQYCHLAKGSVRVRIGEEVKAGQPIGQIGLSGQTEFTHLHFTLRSAGRTVDPFAYDAPENGCNGGKSLWQPDVRAALAYRAATVINRGFAAKAVSMADIESGATPQPGADAPVFVAYVRAIGLKAGDVQQIRLVGPDGAVLVDQTAKPLERAQAQYMLFVGRKRPLIGWKPGSYRATYRVQREGALALEESFELRL